MNKSKWKEKEMVYLRSPDEASLVSCPICGEEWDIKATEGNEVLETLDERDNHDESGVVTSVDSLVKCKKCKGIFITRGVV